MYLKLWSKLSKDVLVAYNELHQIIGKMKTEMQIFKNQCLQKSDICNYVLQDFKLINLVEMLIAADTRQMEITFGSGGTNASVFRV